MSGEVKLEPCPFCGCQPKQSSCMAPELVRCVNDERPHCPASFGGVSVETWNRRQPQSVGDAWVKWEEGDPLPPLGRYVVSRKQGRDAYTEVAQVTDQVVKGSLRWWPLMFSNGPVIAYLPTRLPDPYIESDGRQGAICSNCDTQVPPGCEGTFRDDGESCRLNSNERGK